MASNLRETTVDDQPPDTVSKPSPHDGQLAPVTDHANETAAVPPATSDSRSSNTHNTVDPEKGAVEGGAEVVEEQRNKEKDPNIVDWDGPDDPENPLNWTPKRKWSIAALLSFMTFVTPLASSMFAPGIPEVMADFHHPYSLLSTFVVSVYVLGYAIGPLIMSPMSELYGRLPVYHVTNAIFIVFTSTCCLQLEDTGRLMIIHPFFPDLKANPTIYSCLCIEHQPQHADSFPVL